MSLSDAELFAEHLLELYPEEEVKQVVKKDDLAVPDDPVEFGESVFGHSYTEGQKKVMRSVLEYPITIARSANAVGKSFASAVSAVHFYKRFVESQVYTTAAPPEDNLIKILWAEIGSLVASHPDLFQDDRVRTLNIERHPRQFITGVRIPTTGSSADKVAKFSGKHQKFLLFTIDEGDAVPEEVYTGIEGCMSGGEFHMLIMFNPRSRMGPVWRMERDGQANVIELSALDHPNVITGKDIIPGAVDRNTTVRRINEWTRELAQGEEPNKEECFVVPDFLVGATAKAKDGRIYPPLPPGWRKIIEASFYYMVLGRYPAKDEFQLISLADVSRARKRWDDWVAENGEIFPGGAGIVAGVDVAEFGNDKNVVFLRQAGFLARPQTWSGVDPLVTGVRAARICKQNNIVKAFVDGTGVGSGTAPKMNEEGVPAVSVKVASSPTFDIEQGEFQTLRDQIAWSFSLWVASDESMIPPDEELIEEMTAITHFRNAKGKIQVTSKNILREKLKRSSDKFDSATLTFADEVGVGGVEVDAMGAASFLGQQQQDYQDSPDLEGDAWSSDWEEFHEEFRRDRRPEPQPQPTPAQKEIDKGQRFNVKYLHQSRGQHMVVGPVTLHRYGYFSGGDIIKSVWEADILARPDLFEITDEEQERIEAGKREPPSGHVLRNR